MLKEKKRMVLVMVFTKPLQGLRGRGAEPHIGKKVVGKAFRSKKGFLFVSSVLICVNLCQ